MQQLSPGSQEPKFDITNPIADPATIQQNTDATLGRQLSQIIGLQAALELAYGEIARLKETVDAFVKAEVDSAAAEGDPVDTAPAPAGGLPPRRTA